MSVLLGILNPVNINRICRVCLEEKTESLPIFTTITFEEELGSLSISEIMDNMALEKIETEVQLSLLICKTCVELLKSAYIFKVKYECATSILKKYLECSVKYEECDNVSISDDVTKEEDCESDQPLSERVIISNKVGKKRKKRIVKTTFKEEDYQVKSEESTPIAHPCPICTVELPAMELREHAQTHKALKKYLNIPKNERITKTVQFYAKQRHVSGFFQQSKITHECTFCEKSFTAAEFRLHIEEHRKQDEYKCSKCERVFKKINHLNTHLVKHLQECPYKCESCNKGFVIKKNYDCHVLTHSSSELPHECSYCLKRFSNPEHLNRHQLIHTENVSYSVKYKVCKCNHCLKSFRDKESLDKHECTPIDSSVKPHFQCKTCKRVFKQYSALYRHNRNLHQLKLSKTLCSVCGVYVSNIYTHTLRHSGEKPYGCHQCEKQFLTKPQLRQHLLVHSGLKPYVCSVCAKAFNNLYNLQVHERIHKGDRCHICPICNKGFLEKSYLKKHMNVHKNV